MLSLGAADSFIIRYYGDDNIERVIVIDAGRIGHADKIINHIRRYTESKKIDLAICTHPDIDHIGGFFKLIDTVQIDNFWIHDPTAHVEFNSIMEELSLLESASPNLQQLNEGIKHSYDLISKIKKAGINLEEPFDGLICEFAPIKVLSPTIPFYRELLNRFKDIDYLTYIIIAEALNENEESSLDSKVVLDKNDDPSPVNNSSTVILFEPDNDKHLFTGDIGTDALTSTLDRHDIGKIFWLDVPHHGSKGNISSTLISRLSPDVAYISADGSKHHPHWSVILELKKIGCAIYSTDINGNMLFRFNTEKREGYSTAKKI